MSAKTKKFIIQEDKKDYGEEAAEETREKAQGDDELDKGNKEFKEARAEEIAFDRAGAEGSATRAHSQKARSMAGYRTGTENDTEEEEKEENLEGNCKHPETNPIGGSRGWEKESAVRARLERGGSLARHATGISNKP